MSFLFGSKPEAPPPPPPPPSAPRMGDKSILEQGASERQNLAAAAGSGQEGTDVTGGKATGATTTKSLLGG